MNVSRKKSQERIVVIILRAFRDVKINTTGIRMVTPKGRRAERWFLDEGS